MRTANSCKLICDLCGHDQFDHVLATRDHFYTGEPFDIVRCRNCCMRYTHPFHVEHVHKYYPSNNYLSHNSEKKGLFPWLYRLARTWNTAKKIKQLNRLHPGAQRVLDFGSGNGYFANQWRKITGAEVYTYEPSEAGREQHTKFPELKALSSIDEIPQGSLDIITMWHVLEHVPSPTHTLEMLASKLAPSGHLVLALPNPESFDSTHYGSYWAGYDTPRHFSHFSKKQVRALLHKEHLYFCAYKPLWLDAFYVSLLSAKYSHSSRLKALFIALLSNLKALKTHEYSSLIYIAKKTTVNAKSNANS